MKRILTFLLTAMAILGTILPLPVFATTANLTIINEGHYTVGTYPAGGFANLNVDGGDATRLNFPNGFSGESVFHTYDMLAFTGTANDGINSVTLYVKARSISEDVILRPVCRIGDADYLGSEWSFGTLNYQLESYSWTANPSTGTAWTAATIDSAEFGFNRPAMYESYITQMYVVVDYNAQALPTISTDAASDIAETSVTMNGEVTEDGGQDILTRGFVWSITSNSTTPGNVVPPALYTWSWTEGAGAGDYGENPFTYDGAVLTANITYYYRACAQNTTGWAYGDEETFTTLGAPSITIVAATYVEATTARLNALVNSDGGQACDVRFGYDTVSRSCNFTLYTHVTDWVNDTYYKGQTPYVDITGLTANITYYFCVQIRNDVSTQSGGSELNLLTETGVDEPTNFKGIPTATTASLTWVKGDGATQTIIVYKLGAYPTNVNDGTQVYTGSETSTLHSGLSPGTTGYYSAWGKSGGTYSGNYTTLMVTTLAGSSTTGLYGTVATPTWWLAAPDHTKMNKFPFYGMVNWVADCYQIPQATMWFFLAMLMSIIVGAAVYMMSNSFKAPLALMAETGCMVIGTAIGLIPGWLIFFFLVFAITSLVVGNRT